MCLLSYPPLRFPIQQTKLPIKIILPEHDNHWSTFETNQKLIQKNFAEAAAFDYWDCMAVESGPWIWGLLPSMYLAALMYMKEFTMSIPLDTDYLPIDCPRRLMWPSDCGGILGMDRSHAQAALAVGHPGYLGANDECRELASLFADSRMTDPNETWYVQGKFQYLWVLQHCPDGTIRQLKVCGVLSERGFDISCVQKKEWDACVVKVVEAMGPAGHQLPVIVQCADQWGAKLTFFHCAWLPTKLISDFKITMQGGRGSDGWIPPITVNPKLYDINGQYLSLRRRLFSRPGQK